MRTLKKTLCLVLAVVMVLGLCAFGVSAEFNDADKIQYSEAADVLNAIGVIKGTGAGDFDPAKELTRAEGATIIARLLGQNSENGTAPFDDCDSVNSWAGFAIDYCASQGIIAGDGNGHFLPTQPLTGSAFAKMLLTALGYDAEIEGLTGAGWEVGVAKLIRSISLDDGIDDFDQTKTLNRETAAQLAFTALTETMVYYPARIDKSDGSINTNIQTENVENTASTYERTAAGLQPGIGALNSQDDNPVDTMQLCEKYFSKLLKVVDDTNEDGRLATTWNFKGEKVTTEAKTPKYKTVAGTTKTYKDIIEDYNKTLKFPGGASITTTVYLNGTQIGDGATAASTSNAALATNARVGDVIELYVKDDDVTQISNVVITRYRAHDVTGAIATRTSGSVDQIRVPGVVNTWTNIDDVIGYEGLEKDDIVYYYQTANGVYHLFKAESFDGVLTAMAPVDGSTPAKYTISGTKYSINGSTGEGGDAGATGTQYNDTYKYYTDDNDFIIWSTLVESGSKDYVMVYDLKYLAPSSSSGLGTNGSAEARLVFMDGTTKVVPIDNIDGYKPVNVASLNVGAVAAAAAVSAGDVTAARVAKSVTTGTTTGAKATVGLTAGHYYIASTAAAGPGVTISERFLALDATTVANNLPATRDRLYTYTVSSDGKYTLTDATAQTNVTSGGFNTDAAVATNAKSGTLSTAGATNSVAVNSDTIFVVINNPGATENAQDDPKFTVYEGKDKCPEFVVTTGNVTYAYTTERGSATYVVVSHYTGTASGGSYIYLLESKSHEQTTMQFDDGGKTSYFVYSAYVETSGEVEDILLTDTADAIARANGIGLYTAPAYDSHGNYDTMTFATSTTTAVSDRNQTVALGYRLSGSTLQVNRSYGNAPTWGYAYDCPSSTILITKDGGDFTVGTAADLSDDANDQIYVALTNATDNKTQIIYVVKRDADETGVASVTTGAAVTATNTGVGATTATPVSKYVFAGGTTPTVTIGGKTYSVDHYDGVAAGTVYVNLNSRCQVTLYDSGTVGSTYAGNPAAVLTAANCTTNATTATAQTPSGVSFTLATNDTVILRIQAEDGETLGFITVGNG